MENNKSLKEHKESAVSVSGVQPPDMFYALLEKLMVNPSVSADKIKVLTDMQVYNADRVARVAFSVAMSKVQTELRIIPEDMANNQTHSEYSSYKTILKHVKPLYTTAGFALMFYEEDSPRENEIRICVDIMHEKGHTETHHTDIPIDDRGIKGTINKTRPHAKGSSISYGRSYLIKMIFNLSTGSVDDDDGNAAGGKPSKASDKQIKEIKDLREIIKLSEENFKARLKKRFRTDCPRDLSYSQAKELIKALTMMKRTK